MTTQLHVNRNRNEVESQSKLYEQDNNDCNSILNNQVRNKIQYNHQLDINECTHPNEDKLVEAEHQVSLMMSDSQVVNNDYNVNFHYIQQPAPKIIYLNDLQTSLLVMQDGHNNAHGLRIPIPLKWNMKLFDALCMSAADRQVADYLRFGWPLSRDDSPVTQTWGNHNSALQYPQQVTEYICKEMKYGTLMGRFATSPYPL